MPDVYQNEIKGVKIEINRVKLMDTINEKLQRLNWIFLHPFSQGMDISYMQQVLKEDGSEEKIKDYFAIKFFNLPATIHLVDGMFKRRPFLKEFEYFIEESIVLCIQKDFRGAISTLLPVIEGTLRKYYLSRGAIAKRNTTKISDLIKSSEILTKDYLRIKMKYIFERANKENSSLSIDQVKNLEKLHREYFEIWVKQLNRYLENNLYHYYTGEGIVRDSFNRHAIFHAFNERIEYSLANYLRLFNCISFLSWIMGVVNEGCSALSEVGRKEVIEKWSEYLKILSVSEALTKAKSKIYGQNLEGFSKYLSNDHLVLMKRPQRQVDSALKHFDFMKQSYKPRAKDLLKLLLGKNSIKRERNNKKKIA